MRKSCCIYFSVEEAVLSKVNIYRYKYISIPILYANFVCSCLITSQKGMRIKYCLLKIAEISDYIIKRLYTVVIVVRRVHCSLIDCSSQKCMGNLLLKIIT